MLVVDLRTLIGAGLLVALASAILPLFVGQPFFKGLWTTIEVGGNEIHLGTPLLFDLGVFLLVVGVAMLMVLTLLEPAGRRAGGSA